MWVLATLCVAGNVVALATSKTPATQRFTIADEKGMDHDMENQRNWNDLVMQVHEIQ